MPNQESKNALVQLLEMLNLQGRPVELHLEDMQPEGFVGPPAPTTPPIQDPLAGGMKHMSPEGNDLMLLLQHFGSSLGPEDLHEDSQDVLNRIPAGRTIGDQGGSDAETL